MERISKYSDENETRDKCWSIEAYEKDIMKPEDWRYEVVAQPILKINSNPRFGREESAQHSNSIQTSVIVGGGLGPKGVSLDPKNNLFIAFLSHYFGKCC